MKSHLDDLKKLFPGSVFFLPTRRLSITITTPTHHVQLCLIIDNIGMFPVYINMVTITYVGGGLKTMGVHNVLEAAVYSKPVLSGLSIKNILKLSDW